MVSIPVGSRRKEEHSKRWCARTRLQNLGLALVLCIVDVAHLSVLLELKLQEIEAALSSPSDTTIKRHESASVQQKAQNFDSRQRAAYRSTATLPALDNALSVQYVLVANVKVLSHCRYGGEMRPISTDKSDRKASFLSTALLGRPLRPYG